MATRDVTFRIDLPDAQASTVRALGDHTIDEALQALAEIAVREWLEWLIADDRPASLTEVSKRRVKALVESGLLPKLPTAPVIAQRARLSLGQARYIVSTLALEDPSGTLEARQGLVGRLRAALKDAGVPDPDHLDERGIESIARNPSIEFDVPRSEAELAAATHEELLNARFSVSGNLRIDAFEPPRRRRRTDSYVALSLRPHVAASILQRLLAAQ